MLRQCLDQNAVCKSEKGDFATIGLLNKTNIIQNLDQNHLPQKAGTLI